MPQEGEPDLVYLAAKAGKLEQLQALLQDRLPRARPQDYPQAQKDEQVLAAAHHLEYVDQQTGYTPLLAAVFWHRPQAVRLLLEHGADVHAHHAKTKQTPLRLALCDPEMDPKLIELLVYYGASPFLEAKDGMTPMDVVVQMRQNQLGQMPYALGSVLLCLRRRCAFRGHLELKVDRYMGLSQTWRKFFCVLAPRETVAGYATEMQLLVFSKNGFDPVTKVLMTNAAPIQVPLKAAHGLACFELALSSKQSKKPSKLFAPGSPRVGYSIYVRALSKDAVETRWLHKFLDLATCDPSLAMLNGDSEVQAPATTHDHTHQKMPADGSPEQHSKSSSQAKNASFSSDSAHVPQHGIPRLSEATVDQSEATSRSAVPSTPPQPDRSSLVPNALSAAVIQRANSNEIFHGGNAISSSTGSYRATQSLPSAKSFTPIDKQLIRHWRAKAMQGLDERDSLDTNTADKRMPLPVVSEHDLSPSLIDEWGSSPTDQLYKTQHTAEQQPPEVSRPQQGATQNPEPVLAAMPKLSNNPIFIPAPQSAVQPLEARPVQAAAWYSCIGPPASRSITYVTDSSPVKSVASADVMGSPAEHHTHSHQHTVSALQGNSLDHLRQQPQQQQQQGPRLQPAEHMHREGQSKQQQQPQSKRGPPSFREHAEDDFEDLELAVEHNDKPVDEFAAQARHAPSLASMSSEVPSLLIESNLEAVRARREMLDIPSAELLDSILDFANTVCGEQPPTPFERATAEQTGSCSQAWESGSEVQAQSTPAKRPPAAYSMMSRTSVASSVEPFSDDDDVTILDTTEVKKLLPPPLQALPEGQQPKDVRYPSPLKRSELNPDHLDGLDEEDLVYEMGARSADQPFHHYALSAQLMESSSLSAAARYGHNNRMYDTSMSDLSNHAANSSALHESQHSPKQNGSTGGASSPQYKAQHHSNIYNSSGSQTQESMTGVLDFPVSGQEQLFDIVDHAVAVPHMAPVEFREMIDGIMAVSEQQAHAQIHMSGGAAANAAALHPIWEDEEVCLIGHDSPCVATIGSPPFGVCAT